MKFFPNLLLLASLALFHHCSTTAQSGESKYVLLSPADFQAKINELTTAPLLDVRTPGEYMGGHIANSQNVDWNSAKFEEQVKKLDKTKPVLIYCLSGGRSGSASRKLQSMGFTQIYELAGGMMKWRGASMPEVKGGQAPQKKAEMTLAQYDALANNADKLVLVDFYADWCAPCQKMKPYLEEISNDMKDKVIVVRINADDHPSLMKELGVDGLPVLRLYKKGAQVWDFTGWIPKADVVKAIDEG